jgi:hypothetical protein
MMMLREKARNRCFETEIDNPVDPVLELESVVSMNVVKEKSVLQGIS